MKIELIVSTDMDGTLLDHDDYSWQSAKPAIDRLIQNNVPIIFNTSKTFSESKQLQAEIGIHHALIVENGSALFIPELDEQVLSNFTGDKAIQIIQTELGWQVIFGHQRDSLLEIIHALREEHHYPFEGFSDWSVEQISQHTGLSLESAELSAQKQFSEPFIWQGDDNQLSEFVQQLESHGLYVTKGGRFYHVQGQTNKAKPLLWLQQYYADLENGYKPKLICLGDNQNDVKMLEVADYPVCVKSPVSDYPRIDTDKPVIYTDNYGPKGWNQAIQMILDERDY